MSVSTSPQVAEEPRSTPARPPGTLAKRAATPSRGRRPDPRKRESIIEAAADLFVAHGYAITMDAIAAAAGVSKQTIYNLFSNKDDLFTAVITNRTEGLLAPLSRPDPDAGPETVLLEVGQQFLSLVAGAPGMCVQRMIIMSGCDPKPVKNFYETGPRRVLSVLAAYLQQECDRGRLRLDDPELAAEAFLGMLNGHIQTRSLLGIQTDWDPEYLSRKANFAVDTFLRAYGQGR